MSPPVLTECRSCKASIAWLWTKNNRKMPVNADSLAPTDDRLTEFDPKTHISHFATCTTPKRFRKQNSLSTP